MPWMSNINTFRTWCSECGQRLAASGRRRCELCDASLANLAQDLEAL